MKRLNFTCSFICLVFLGYSQKASYFVDRKNTQTNSSSIVSHIDRSINDTIKGFIRMNWLVPMDSITYYQLQRSAIQNKLPKDYYVNGAGGVYYKKDIKSDTLPFHERTYIVRDGNKINYLLQLLVIFEAPETIYADLRVKKVYIRSGSSIRRLEDKYVLDLIKEHDEKMKESPPPPIPPPPPPPND